MKHAKEQIAPQGIVLYDDTCGFCRQWIPFWGKTLRQTGFTIGSLQSPDVAARLQLSNEELTKDLRLLLSDGTQIVGADVYRYVMRRIWWAYPIYLLSVSPVFSKVFDWAYRAFANNRYRISSKCGLRIP
jgi:predicted DCC family thiol-disulfide oxidoreductase YuxK